MPAPDYAVEIAALRTGLASGEAEVRDASGQSVKYRTPEEIRMALKYFEAEAARAAGTVRRPRIINVISGY